MALIIGGHVRSGTTLLRNLCHAHPDIAVTMEFQNFIGLGKSYRAYARQILNQWWRNRHRSFLHQGETETHWRPVLMSHLFVARYLVGLSRHRGSCIDACAVETALKTIFPTAFLVGDKMPHYVFRLSSLVEVDQLIRIIMYRDCRDVVSSALRMVRTDWRGRAFTKKYDTARKAAQTWVKAVEVMECHARKLHIIKYEDLVTAPEQEIPRLAGRLNVDSEGFPNGMIRKDSVGKHKPGLSEEQLAAVMEVAGPTLRRLGYV